EVRAALRAADRHAGERVLEDLLEAEELDDAEVDARVEAQAALVRPERRVELDAEAAVELDTALVVRPRHAEDDLPLRLTQSPDDLGLRVLGMLRDDRTERLEDLAHRLMELGLTRVASDDLVEDRDEPFMQHDGQAGSIHRWEAVRWHRQQERAPVVSVTEIPSLPSRERWAEPGVRRGATGPRNGASHEWTAPGARA